MAPLYWSPAIVIGADRYYLPPWISLRDTWSQNVEVLRPPYANRPIIAEVYDNEPIGISLEAIGLPSGSGKVRKVLDWMALMRAQLRGRTFSLYLFNDRGYEVCALSGDSQEIPLGRLTHFATSLDLISETPMSASLPTLDFPGGYENDYPYAHLVGRPDGESSSGGGISVIQQPRQTPSGVFTGGQYEETNPGSEHVYVVGGSVGSVWTVDQIQVSSALNFDASANTTVVVSTTPKGVAGSELSVILGAAETATGAESGGFPVTAGSNLYVYIDTAGGHSDVQYQLQLRG